MSIKDVIPEGIASLVPDNLSDRTALSDLRSILVRDATKVDPTFDITGARTETETRPELLAAVPEFSGFEFDPTQRSYIEDLYALYSGGVPTRDVAMGDTAQIPGAVDTLVNVGEGESGATLPGFDVDSPKNTLDGLTQSGTFAGQPTFTTTPGTTVDNVTGDITNPDGSYGGNIVDEVALTGLAPSTPLDRSISVEDLSQPSNIGDFQITTAPDLPNQTGIIPEASIVDPRLETRGPITVDRRTGEILDANRQDIGNIYDEVALTGAQTDSLSALAKASNSIADFGKKVQDTLGGIFDSVNNTIDVFGQKFNVAKTATGLALNTVFGAPVSLALGLLPKQAPENIMTTNIVDELKAEKDYGFNIQSGNLNQDPFGRNPVSAFGNYEQTLANDAVSTSTTKMGKAKKEFAQDYFNKKASKTAPQEDIGSVSGDVTTGADPITGDLPGGGNIVDEFKDTTPFSGPNIAEVTDGGPTSDEDPSGIEEEMSEVSLETPSPLSDALEELSKETTGGDTESGGGNVEAASGDTYGGAAYGYNEAAEKSDNGGSGGGGGKVVCTMMNESYGFGSFRNKIWMKFHKNLSPEYQRGYHKIFLPLVKLSKTNKILKKTLEHIAVHSTIDMRQSMRGKIHFLGRIYRKILLPICYWVGKYAKR